MDIERRKILEQTMKDINKSIGRKDQAFADFAINKQEKPTLSWGIPEIDSLTGGLMGGNFTVVYGAESAGKSTICLQTIAELQKIGKICAYIDLEHSFESERAIILGVNLEDLVLIEDVDNAEEAMDAVIKLAKSRVVDIVCVDSIQAMTPKDEKEDKNGKEKSTEDNSMALLARKLGQFFRMSAPDVFRAKMVVLLIGQVRTEGLGSFIVHDGLSGGKALKHWMHTCVHLRRGQGADAPTEDRKEFYTDEDGKERYKTVHDKIGFSAVAKLEKTKYSKAMKENSTVTLPFYYESGFLLPERLKAKIAEEEKEIQEQIEPTTIPPTIELNERKFTEEESKELDKPILIDNGGTLPKRRGRPKKEKEN